MPGNYCSAAWDLKPLPLLDAQMERSLHAEHTYAQCWTSFHGDTDRHMGFANAGRSQQDNILGAGNESQSSQFVDLPFVNGRLKTEVEFLQTFSAALIAA